MKIDRNLARQTLETIAPGRKLMDPNYHILDEFTKGMNVELEHSATIAKLSHPDSNELAIIGSIVLDHLREDIHYYTKLKQAGL